MLNTLWPLSLALGRHRSMVMRKTFVMTVLMRKRTKRRHPFFCSVRFLAVQIFVWHFGMAAKVRALLVDPAPEWRQSQWRTCFENMFFRTRFRTNNINKFVLGDHAGACTINHGQEGPHTWPTRRCACLNTEGSSWRSATAAKALLLWHRPW